LDFLFKKLGVSALFGGITFLVFVILGLVLSIPIGQTVNIGLTFSVVVAATILIEFLISELDRIARVETEALEKETYERDNPTVAMYRELHPDEYIELFSQNPEAFVNFCPSCGALVRVCHTRITEKYNSLTGKPERQSMTISCSGCGEFKHTVRRIFEDGGKDGNQIKRLQGDDLEVVEADEENSDQLPPKLVSID
jgi:hypothetical protein